jgi:hypothetical protein
MPGTLVTVDSFMSMTAASLARARLEADGIRCHVANERVTSFGEGVVPALLQVREEDAERARAILREGAEHGRIDPEDGPVCPQCGGQYAVTERSVGSVIVAVLTFGRAAVRTYARCRKCGHAWTPTAPSGDPYRS